MVNMDKSSFNLFSVFCILTVFLCLCYFNYNDWIDKDKSITYRRPNIKWYDQLTHSNANMQPMKISEKKDFQGDSTTNYILINWYLLFYI
jgi:hypothetical protein